MPLPPKFGAARGGGAPGALPARQARPAAAAVSRYAGIKAGEDRDPMPHVGDYRLRVMELLEGTNPGKGNRMSTKIGLQIVTCYDENNANHRDGDLVRAVHLHTTAGLAELKRAVMTAAGYDVEEEFDAFETDPRYLGPAGAGQVIDASIGRANGMFEAGMTIVGRLVDVRVTKGNDTPNGDYYRKYQWAVVEESEQDQVAKLEWTE